MTGRRLVLVRHAKTGDGPVDFDRALTDRGEHDALAVGQWLRRHEIVPDHVVVSPAQRTRQTWARASLALTDPVEAVTDARIYDNSLGALAAVLRESPAAAETVVLVGHNPSISATALALDDGSAAAELRHALDDGFPTSGVAVFAVPGEWAQLGPESATLIHFTAARRG